VLALGALGAGAGVVGATDVAAEGEGELAGRAAPVRRLAAAGCLARNHPAPSTRMTRAASTHFNRAPTMGRMPCGERVLRAAVAVRTEVAREGARGAVCVGMGEFFAPITVVTFAGDDGFLIRARRVKAPTGV